LKDPEYLYLLLEICYGITLDKLLQMTQKFSQNFTKLIAAQVYFLRKIFFVKYFFLVSSHFRIYSFGWLHIS